MIKVQMKFSLHFKSVVKVENFVRTSDKFFFPDFVTSYK